jgi:hypothetical protein
VVMALTRRFAVGGASLCGWESVVTEVPAESDIIFEESGLQASGSSAVASPSRVSHGQRSVKLKLYLSTA